MTAIKISEFAKSSFARHRPLRGQLEDVPVVAVWPDSTPDHSSARRRLYAMGLPVHSAVV
jgi:hypothetical protein